MKHMLLTGMLILALLLSALLMPGTAFAQETDGVTKTYCTSAAGYADIDTMKADLLANAKRLVVNELFGELIAASTSVEDMVVTSDQIRASSLGFVRTSGDAQFNNGEDFAEICVSIDGYVTEEDLLLFEAVEITKRHCITDADKTTAQLISFAREEVIVQALADYDRTLASMNRNAVLQLMQRIEYIESGFVPDTETYCVQVEGTVVPIEVLAFIESAGISVETLGGRNENIVDQDEEESDTVSEADYFDAFDDQGDWNIGVETSDPSTGVFFDDGELTIRVEKSNWVDGTVNNALVGANFRAEVDVQHVTGRSDSPVGFVFRGDGLKFDNFYTFDISIEDGWFRLLSLKDNEWETIQEWTTSNEIKREAGAVNRIGVIANGRIITLLINGVEVGQVRDTTFVSGSFGLTVTNQTNRGVEFAFDNFEYRELP